MRYFNSLPSIINADNQNNFYTLKNLVTRSKLVSTLAKNPLVFYNYSIQDTDTPEIIAKKYYEDSYRYWLVLLANEYMDPQWSWPLNSKQFTEYLIDKYKEEAGAQPPVEYTQTTVHHYEKLITSYDDGTQTTVVKNIIIGEKEYNSMVEKEYTNRFNYGDNIKYTLTKKSVSIYDYEYQLNESKRNIKLINSIYIPQIELQFQVLMGT